jgi:hypothetical protein
MTIASIGDTLESAVWLDGRETIEDRVRFQRDAIGSLEAYCARHGRSIGPVMWVEKKPGEPRVPPVPAHIKGPLVRLLVAEAPVIAEPGIKIVKPGFVHDLEPNDAALLRRITRKQYRKAYPDRRKYPDLTDRQCDTLLNDLGPQAAVDTLKSMRRSDLI